MAKTDTTTTKAPKTQKAVAQPHPCACGCGAEVLRTFKQGHDQKLISNLASDIVYSDVWDGKCMGILKGAAVRGDIQERINTVSQYMSAKLSEPLAAKFEKAVARAWELEKTRDARLAAKETRKKEREQKTANSRAAKAAKKAAEPTEPKPPRKPMATTAKMTNEDVDKAEAAADKQESTNGYKPGATIKIKAGKRTRNATVRGMSQSGKVTAVAFMNAGKEVVKQDGEFEIV
jgi:hypothetical protein